MDPQVLIRAIQAAETILGRINSKRLLTFYAFLLFLVYCENEPWKLALGFIAFALTLWMIWRDPGNADGIDTAPKSV